MNELAIDTKAGFIYFKTDAETEEEAWDLFVDACYKSEIDICNISILNKELRTPEYYGV